MLNYKGEPFKDISALGLSKQQIQSTPESELLKIAPISPLGKELSVFLIGILQPKDALDAANLTRWATRINNKMDTGDGIIELDTKDLHELLNIFKTNPAPVNSAHVLGSIVIFLEQKEIELKQKSKVNDVTV